MLIVQCKNTSSDIWLGMPFCFGLLRQLLEASDLLMFCVLLLGVVYIKRHRGNEGYVSGITLPLSEIRYHVYRFSSGNDRNRPASSEKKYS